MVPKNWFYVIWMYIFTSAANYIVDTAYQFNVISFQAPEHISCKIPAITLLLSGSIRAVQITIKYCVGISIDNQFTLFADRNNIVRIATVLNDPDPRIKAGPQSGRLADRRWIVERAHCFRSAKNMADGSRPFLIYLL